MMAGVIDSGVDDTEQKRRSGLGGTELKGIGVSGNFVEAPAVSVLVAIPSEVIWSYFAGGVVFAIGLGAMFLRGDWQKARGFDKLILFGPLFYAAPVAAFGTEHFTLTAGVASHHTDWIPPHSYWASFYMH